MNVIPTGIPAEIRAELAKRKMSMRDLSEKTGLSYDTVIRKISNESRLLDVAELFLIAGALDVSPAGLVANAENSKQVA